MINWTSGIAGFAAPPRYLIKGAIHFQLSSASSFLKVISRHQLKLATVQAKNLYIMAKHTTTLDM